MTASKIIADLLIEIPKQFPARVWRRNVGAAMAGDRFIRFAVPGEADITGIIHPGIRLEIEVKAGKDKLSEAQRNFLQMVRSHGGIALVSTDVEQTLRSIETLWRARTSPSASPENQTGAAVRIDSQTNEPAPVGGSR